MESLSRDQLMHLRLQAWMREFSCPDLEYIGLRDGEHWYRIDTYEVPVSLIEGLDESDE